MDLLTSLINQMISDNLYLCSSERIERIIVRVEWNLVIEDVTFVPVLIFGHPTSVFMISVSEVKLTLLFFFNRNAGN